jgi:beta-phosphoglucomutase
MSRFDAILFDLDGVLADSATAHYAGWKRLADELGIAFTEQDNEALKGVDRMGSLRHILALGGRSVTEAEMLGMAARKNGYYLEAVARMTPADLLPGALELVGLAKRRGLRCGVASASRNAPLLLDRLGVAALFDVIADAGAVAHPKPAPDIFLACADTLRIDPARCIGVEDAAAGVTAIKAAGMYAIGVGDPAILAEADLVYPTTATIDLDAVLAG